MTLRHLREFAFLKTGGPGHFPHFSQKVPAPSWWVVCLRNAPTFSDGAPSAEAERNNSLRCQPLLRFLGLQTPAHHLLFSTRLTLLRLPSALYIDTASLGHTMCRTYAYLKCPFRSNDWKQWAVAGSPRQQNREWHLGGGRAPGASSGRGLRFCTLTSLLLVQEHSQREKPT